MLINHHYPNASAIDLLATTTPIHLFSPLGDPPYIHKRVPIKDTKKILKSLEGLISASSENSFS